MNEAIWIKLWMSADTYAPLMALCVYLSLWRYIKKKELLLLAYLILNVVFTAITNVMGYYHINNLALYHFYILFEQWFILYYFFKKILKKKISIIYYAINVGFTAFWIADIMFWEPLNTFNSNTIVISNFIILLVCMYYVFSLAKKDEILYFQKLPAFWITSSFLVYSALSMLIYTVYKYYAFQSSDRIVDGNKLWNINLFIVIPAKFILMSIGFIAYKKNKELAFNIPSEKVI